MHADANRTSLTYAAIAACLCIAARLGFGADAPAERIAVDFAREAGRVRAIHGVNGGPISNGENPDLRDWFKEAGFPVVRLHDCHWPCPDVVDIHTVFPLAHLDPDDPAHYTFAKTDDYIRGILDTGAKIVYRLGESIETKGTRYHITPPRDLDVFARVCVNIVRHYNAGWAAGHRHGIEYWEIWNEPDIAEMWTGTKEDYFALYEKVARALKAHDPALKVGGPALAGANAAADGWARAFLARCRDRGLPLDFFSFHSYGGDVPKQCRVVRALLDEYGFEKTEIHLNEFRHMPGTWRAIRPGDRDQYVDVPAAFEKSTGGAGAAHAIDVLVRLQDERVAMTNYYSADTSPWSMFGQFGIRRPVYHAFRAFNELVRRPVRGTVTVAGAGGAASAVLAGKSADGGSAAVLVSTFRQPGGRRSFSLAGLPWDGEARVEALLVDDTRAIEAVPADVTRAADGTTTVVVDLPADAVCLLRVAPR